MKAFAFVLVDVSIRDHKRILFIVKIDKLKRYLSVLNKSNMIFSTSCFYKSNICSQFKKTYLNYVCPR